MEVTNIRTISNTGGFSTKTVNGRNYMIVPAVPVREQVMNNYYVPAEELVSAEIWNGTPITIRHPKNNNGSAQVPEPDVAVIGRFFNGMWDDVNKRVTGDYYIDVDEAMRFVEGQYIINAIKMGNVLETSTGYWADEDEVSGSFNNKAYDTIHHNLKPDHIAILVDQIGACSVADGCGVNVNSLVNQLWQNECLYTFGGAGSGDFGHGGRPGSVGGSAPRTKAKPNTPDKAGKNHLSKSVSAYYVATKAKSDKVRSGTTSRTSLASAHKAEQLYNAMHASGFDPVIFEINLKKGDPYISSSSSSITVPSIPSGQIHEITIDKLRSKSQSGFSANNLNCDCPNMVQNAQDSLYSRIEDLRSTFYDTFNKPMQDMQDTYIKDMFDNYVVCEMGDTLYKVGYTTGKDGEITFDPKDKWTEVSLQYVETGGSGSASDASGSVTDNAMLPMSCYLVVDKNGKGHLPVKDANGTPNHTLMGAAWAALHGGYRGNKYEGEGKQQAITKLKALYAKEKMPLPTQNVVVTNLTGTLPAAGVKIFEDVYTKALKTYKGDKQKAAQTAWTAVHAAGWNKDASGKWVLTKKKGDQAKNTSSVVLANKRKEKTMSKLTMQSVIDAFKKKGVNVQLNSEDDEEVDTTAELELDTEQEEETVSTDQNASPFTNDEVAGLKKLLAVDWTKMAGLVDKMPAVLEMAQNAETEKATRKGELVSLIMNSNANVLSKEELEAMPLSVLVKLNAQNNVSYAGLGGAMFTNADETDILGLPSISTMKE